MLENVILVVVKALHLTDIVSKGHFDLATSDLPNHLQQPSWFAEEQKQFQACWKWESKRFLRHVYVVANVQIQLMYTLAG